MCNSLASKSNISIDSQLEDFFFAVEGQFVNNFSPIFSFLNSQRKFHFCLNRENSNYVSYMYIQARRPHVKYRIWNFLSPKYS